MTIPMSDEAKKAQLAYNREYKSKNREKINAYNREWRARNKDKVNNYNAKYWEKKAATKNTKQIDPKVDMQSFIDEMCILREDVSTTNKELTDCYNSWSNNNISTTKFSLESRKIASKLGLSQRRNKYEIIW